MQLICFGAPAAGILCKELLTRTFRGGHPLNPQINRSSIIQQLSILVAFLDWVHPSAPNANLCGDCKSVIKRVLDQTLGDNLEGNALPDTFLRDLPSQLDFNFGLLDSYEWLDSHEWFTAET